MEMNVSEIQLNSSVIKVTIVITQKAHYFKNIIYERITKNKKDIS